MELEPAHPATTITTQISLQVNENKIIDFEGKSKQWLKNMFVQNPHPELGTYIYCPKILYDWSAVLLVSPVYLRYDEGSKLYGVQKCSVFQRACCVIATCCFTLSVYHRLHTSGKVLLQNRSYIVAYFDFVNECVLNLFIYAHLYVNWFRLDLLRSYAKELQTTPLLKCCDTPMWKTKLVGMFFPAVSLYLSIIWFFMLYGYDLTSFEGALRMGQVNAREVIWHDRDAPVEPSWIVCVIVGIGRFYNPFMHHMTLNAYCHVGHYCAYFVVDDFFGSLVKKNISPAEVPDLLDDYKVLLQKTNEYLCVYTMNFTAMTLTYHSVHLFDCLNVTDPVWKIQSYIYIGYVFSFYLVPQALQVKTKQLRRWLRMNGNCTKIPHLSLNSMLYDLLDFKYGIRGGRFFILNGEFCGTAVANMISYSMLNMLSKQD